VLHGVVSQCEVLSKRKIDLKTVIFNKMYSSLIGTVPGHDYDKSVRYVSINILL
jgi:hypothetical protein